MRPWIVLGLFVSLGVVGYGERDRDRDKTFDDVVRKQRGADARGGPPHLPLRHLRRRSVLGRRAQAAPGDRGRAQRRRRPGRQPGDRARRRTQGRRRGAARRRAQGDPARPRESERSGGHARPARSQRRRRPHRPARARRPPCLGRHPVRAVPLDGRQLGRARHRPPARRLAEPRSERRRDHRARARSERRRRSAADRSGDGAHGAEQLGAGQVRRAAVPRRQGLPARRQERRDADPGGVRARRRQPAHLYRLGRRRRTGTRSSPTSRCTARARSSTRAWTIRCSFRSRRGPDSATCATIRISSPSKLPALQFYQLSIPAPEPPRGIVRAGGGANAARRSSTAARLLELPRAADLHRAGLEHAHAGGDRHRRLPGQAARPIAATGRRRSAGCSRGRRAASTTTAASPTCARSSITTTSPSTSTSRSRRSAISSSI